MVQVLRNLVLVIGGVAASWVLGAFVVLALSGSMVW